MSERTTHLIERAVARMGAAMPAGLVPAGLVPASLVPASPAGDVAPPPSPSTDAARLDMARLDMTRLDMTRLEAAGLAVGGTRRSRIAEEWRVTAGHLLRTLRAGRANPSGPGPGSGPGLAGAPSNLMMVTSTKPNEGKSFCALNLAGSLTMGGLAEVLLMDIDSKPGALTEALGLGGRPGLFDLVADPSLDPQALMVATAIPGLTVLPIGRLSVSGPAGIDRSVTRPVAALIERVARRFANRVVILDCAPCLATSDPSALAPMVGQIAMIVEAERTQRHELETALELVRTCPSITLVLNKVRMATTHAFGDYHYYDA